MKEKLLRILTVLIGTAMTKGFRLYYLDLQGNLIPLKEPTAAAEWIVEAQTDRSWEAIK
jgi:hypothetical protein